MSLAKLHRTMPTTIWIYPTCCHTFGKSPTNAKDFQKIPTNSKRFHYNLENFNFPGGQSLLGDFSYFYNTWQTECLLCFYLNMNMVQKDSTHLENIIPTKGLYGFLLQD